MPHLTRFLSRFLRDEDGTIAVETMIVLPILIWAYVGTITFWDAYRAQNTNLRAAYTIGDMLSRETNFITPEYTDSLFDLQGFLTEGGAGLRLRITLVRYEEDDDSYRAVWSVARGAATPAFAQNASLASLRPRLPVMVDGENGIIVETWQNFVPMFTVGLTPFDFYEFSITRPRFAGQVCWNSVNEGGTLATAICG